MAVDERSRFELHSQLERVLGAEHAATLMEYLPPVTWADVATKRDLAVLEREVADLRRELGAFEARVDRRFDALEERWDERMRTLEQRWDARFEGLDGRFVSIDERFKRIDERFKRVDERFERIDERFDVIDERFAAFDQRLDERLEATEQRLLAAFRGELVAAVTAQTRILVVALLGTLLTVAGLALAATRLA
jgi:hypothetical protein